MINFPNCKINIGLNITGKRSDGYHSIQSVFYPVPLFDSLEIITSEKTSLAIHGDAILGDLKENLVYKAWELLNKEFKIPSVEIHLLKKIPSGGGLGGGSANGSFMLRLLNDFFQLNITTNKLEEYAASLGSDCPFFIQNKPAIVTGRGEFVQPMNLNLKGKFLLLVNPGIHISTGKAFSMITPTEKTAYLPSEIEKLNLSDWQKFFENDFEKPILNAYPKIQEIAETMSSLGSFYQSLSGTGSTYYGLFHKKPIYEHSFEGCKKWLVEL